jgi:hypothetical protein
LELEQAALGEHVLDPPPHLAPLPQDFISCHHGGPPFCRRRNSDIW